MARWAAYLVVFVASGCTLILEIVAGRILAPSIGVSLYTWTSIIGVVLAGISLGNYVGGRIADRWPSQRTLGLLLGLGGFTSLAILPLINLATTVPTAQLVDAANHLGGGLQLDKATILIARIVAITAIIFFLPCLVLGMVSPIVIKLSLRDVEHSGGLVGKIYALSTLGSILGTFACGFVLIQLMGTRYIVLGVAVILLLMALLFGDVLRSRRTAIPLAAAAVLVALLVPARSAVQANCGLAVGCLAQSAQVGFEQSLDSGCLRETSYYCIRVADEPSTQDHTVKQLILDHLVHSYNALDDPTYLQYGYIKVYAELADYLAQPLPTHDLRILYVGGGGYTLPRYVEATYPEASQVVMEIDPGVTQTVYDRLGVDPATTKIITYNVDARLMVNQLLQTNAGQYDLVIGDAFNDLSIPYHLTTQEFDRDLQRLLKPGGMYVALVIDRLQGGRFIPAYVDTLQTVWPNEYVLSDGDSWTSTDPSTYVVAASVQPLDLARLATVRAQGPQGQRVTHVMPPDTMQAWLAQTPPLILTDDYAPVDNLIAPLFADRGF